MVLALRQIEPLCLKFFCLVEFDNLPVFHAKHGVLMEHHGIIRRSRKMQSPRSNNTVHLSFRGRCYSRKD